MRPEKIWVQQCAVTKRVKQHFGAESALDYLVLEKLLAFADLAERRPEIARELPRFLARIWQIFNEYEIKSYIASQTPTVRKSLQKLLLVN